MWTMILYLKAKSFNSALIQTLGHGFRENGFSIEAGGWDFMCNPFSLSL